MPNPTSPTRKALPTIIEEDEPVLSRKQALSQDGTCFLPQPKKAWLKIRTCFWMREIRVPAYPESPEGHSWVPLPPRKEAYYAKPLWDLDITLDAVKASYQRGYILIIDRFLYDMSIYQRMTQGLKGEVLPTDQNELLRFMQGTHEMIDTAYARALNSEGDVHRSFRIINMHLQGIVQDLM